MIKMSVTTVIRVPTPQMARLFFRIGANGEAYGGGLLGNPAACRGHKTDGVSKGEKRKLSPLVEHGDSNPVFDIT